MQARLKMRRKPTTVIVCSVISLILLLLFFQIVWPPDVIKPGKRIVASFTSKSGDVFEIVQWWNKTDFYSVELLHRDTNGKTYNCLVDPDSPKWWTCRIRPGKNPGTVDVVHHWKTIASYNVNTHTLKTANGVAIPADAK